MGLIKKIYNQDTKKTVIADSVPIALPDPPRDLFDLGWRQYWSKRIKEPYFFNVNTGEKSWTMPSLNNQKFGIFIFISFFVLNIYWIF